ncbi:single-stranded DNA-binding protein [Fervidicella metallireducens AeB]|uniref:Single-stranded DNA-binding protein n=1 Tax=Fervidicella metallireducens AeB TaxID=1403537 RepID=A0A017RXL1_9CLOT|nr:single-stranded DNA-binding protein [Fervidicella metallireducens]EYE89422.1 single-stranded DNA-binding protein [Fervidicella metallireducens AeB]
MAYNLLSTNKVYIEGKIVSELTFSHEMYGEGFYNFTIEVPRLSESMDYLPVTVSERLIAALDTKKGNLIRIEGQLRSYNKFIEGSNRLILTIFARDINPIEEISKSPNQICLDGFICKDPVYRTTPFGREITDLLLAVNRPYNKSDYIPVIAWGRNARFSSILEVGSHIKIWGRIQSREYEKKLSDDNIVKRVAYEVSISKMEKVNEDDFDNGENDMNEENFRE